MLNLTTPAGTSPSAAFSAITIEDLLLHRSRINDDWRRDHETAQAFGKQLPVSEWEVARYVSSLPLLTTAPDYNNYGYQLLGLVVARLRGAASFADAIKTSIFDPLHMTRSRSATSLVGHTPADEARYHRAERDAPRPHHAAERDDGRPAARRRRPGQHPHRERSGDRRPVVGDRRPRPARRRAQPQLPQPDPAAGRPARPARTGPPPPGCRAPATASTACRFDGTTYHAGKGGYLFTSQNAVNFTLDGIGIAVNYNGCNDQVLFQQHWPQIDAAIRNTVWSTKKDHFPDFGMPSLT